MVSRFPVPSVAASGPTCAKRSGSKVVAASFSLRPGSNQTFVVMIIIILIIIIIIIIFNNNDNNNNNNNNQY